jgi:aspartate/methionine/tyrosine aminotransferase
MPREEIFNKIRRLPPYALGTIVDMKTEARQRGEEIIDLGMGNPDLPTPDFIVDKLLLREAKVAVSPGVGFGDNGEGYVRFALVENTHRIQQAVRGIKRVL